jgi:hypothetical protein
LEDRPGAIVRELDPKLSSHGSEKQLWPGKNRFEMDEPLAMILFHSPDKTRLERNAAHL